MSNSTLFRMKRSVKIGTFSFVMGVIVLAALIVANLLVGTLPAKVTRFSLDDRSITDISDDTVKFVSNLSEDVTVYWLCEDSMVDEELSLFLTRYEEAGKHVKVEIIDPLKNPTFTNKYSDTAISEYSIIVESARRYTVVDFMDMYYFTNDFLASELGLTQPLTESMLTSYIDQYAAAVQMYYSGVNLSDYNRVHSFCGEAKLTSAIDYVTREYIPHAYILAGQGKTAHAEAMNELLVSMGVEADALDLGVAAKVPVDANCLILYAPTADLSAHEASLIKDYLNAGGSLILNTAPGTVETMPNLQSVTSLFGLIAASGTVEEGQEAGTGTAGCVQGKPQTLVPTVNTQHSALAYVYGSLQSGSNLPQMNACHAILSAEKLPAGVTVTPLFTTSETATCVSGGMALGEACKLNVAVTATKSVTTAEGTATQAKLTWYGSTAAFGGSSLTANDYYYAATLAVLGDSFSSAYGNLSSVVFETEMLTDLTAKGAIAIGVVTVIVLPLLLLTVGIVIWVRRKRR